MLRVAALCARDCSQSCLMLVIVDQCKLKIKCLLAKTILPRTIAILFGLFLPRRILSAAAASHAVEIVDFHPAVSWTRLYIMYNTLFLVIYQVPEAQISQILV